MEAAYQWFIYAADRLWERKLNGSPDDNTSLARTHLAFDRERWEIWEHALKEARDGCKNKRTQNLIDDALTNMRRVKVSH